jgi:hypothetical protein
LLRGLSPKKENEEKGFVGAVVMVVPEEKGESADMYSVYYAEAQRQLSTSYPTVDNREIQGTEH